MRCFHTQFGDLIPAALVSSIDQCIGLGNLSRQASRIARCELSRDRYPTGLELNGNRIGPS